MAIAAASAISRRCGDPSAAGGRGGVGQRQAEGVAVGDERHGVDAPQVARGDVRELDAERRGADGVLPLEVDVGRHAPRFRPIRGGVLFVEQEHGGGLAAGDLA